MKRTLFVVLCLFTSNTWAQIELLGKFSAGTGCPAEAPAVVSLSPDNSAFSILFTQMDTVTAGQRTEKRKTCDVTIQLGIPKGMQLEFAAVEYRGFMALENANSWGYLNSRAYFMNGLVVLPDGMNWKSTDQSAPVLRFFKPGPINDGFFWRADYDGKAARLISTCDGKAIVRVRSEIISSIGGDGDGSSMVTMDSADGAFSQTYRIVMKPCEFKR